MLRSVIVPLSLVLVVAAGCSASEEISVATQAPTSAPVATTTAPTTVPATTVPATTAAPTIATTTTPVTTGPTTTSTTIPITTQELVLRAEGLGSIEFGSDAEAAIDYVNSILGSPTEDSGWVSPYDFGACPGTKSRRVAWGALALYFGDESRFASGEPHFTSYIYGSYGELGQEPTELTTVGGSGIGSTVAELSTEFPGATIYPEDKEIGLSAYFVPPIEMSIAITGDSPDDVATVFLVGAVCGE
ncbi:MAG: hypothetical protein CSA55_02040 [Ilumatobacter coccineus]|uniref:Uncharacterized protein n=1 Tax=Ilumatobacter coccineus TaxID=467094 RepID=A0A2G6KDA1_9ACTN|nr:MAG: hypothetical protein CSA55_02040 [Ilumatobacter coccineus]